MPVKIAVEPERVLPPYANLVDELYDLIFWAEQPEIKSKLKRIDELKKLLVAEADKEGDRGMKRSLEGERAFADVSAASCKREVVNARRVQEIVGDDAFYQGITVPLSFVDAYLTKEEQAEVIETGEGSRKVEVRPRG